MSSSSDFLPEFQSTHFTYRCSSLDQNWKPDIAQAELHIFPITVLQCLPSQQMLRVFKILIVLITVTHRGRRGGTREMSIIYPDVELYFHNKQRGETHSPIAHELLHLILPEAVRMSLEVDSPQYEPSESPIFSIFYPLWSFLFPCISFLLLL